MSNETTSNSAYGSFYASRNPLNSLTPWSASELIGASSLSSSKLPSWRLIEDELWNLEDYYDSSRVTSDNGKHHQLRMDTSAQLPPSQWPENVYSYGYDLSNPETASRHYTDMTRPVEIDTEGAVSTLVMPSLPFVAVGNMGYCTLSQQQQQQLRTQRPLLAGSDLLLRPFVTPSKPMGSSGPASTRWRYWLHGGLHQLETTQD